MLKPDTLPVVTHHLRSKRLRIVARTEDGRLYPLKYKLLDENRLRVTNKVDSVQKLMLIVHETAPFEPTKWYQSAQALARVLMMVRSVSISYRQQYAMTLPSFMPTIGDAFGQRHDNGLLAPGLGFALGLTDNGYIDKALDRQWLLLNPAIATPATTQRTEDLQVRAVIEPFRDMKIDLNAARNTTRAQRIQYMYADKPTLESGTFSMTTLSLRGAFEGIGNARSGYQSASFARFCNLLDAYRSRIEGRYQGLHYPAGSPMAGLLFNPANGTVNRYSADVMVPAFLSAYTHMGNAHLNLFPTLAHLLPNWTLRYAGLTRLPWFNERFKRFDINHLLRWLLLLVQQLLGGRAWHGLHGRCRNGKSHSE